MSCFASRCSFGQLDRGCWWPMLFFDLYNVVVIRKRGISIICFGIAELTISCESSDRIFIKMQGFGSPLSPFPSHVSFPGIVVGQLVRRCWWSVRLLAFTQYVTRGPASRSMIWGPFASPGGHPTSLQQQEENGLFLRQFRRPGTTSSGGAMCMEVIDVHCVWRSSGGHH